MIGKVQGGEFFLLSTELCRVLSGSVYPPSVVLDRVGICQCNPQLMFKCFYTLVDCICGLNQPMVELLGYGFLYTGHQGSVHRSGITRVKWGFMLGEAGKKSQKMFQCIEEFENNRNKNNQNKTLWLCSILPLLRWRLLLLPGKHWLFAWQL